jgi:outer membrane receptor protein involved in Fe transport
VHSEIRGAAGRETFTGSYADDAGWQFLNTAMDYQRRELSWQTDVGFDLGNSRIEMGQHSRWRSLDANYVATRDNAGMPEMFAHEQSVYAGYVSAARALGGSFLEAGLRAEQSRTGLQLGSERNTRQALDWFSSFKLHWPHDSDDVVQYQLAYASTINRPEAAMLNPFAMGEDDMNAFIGNPALESERAHQVEVSAVRHGSALTWQLTPFARLIQDPIRPLKAVSASGQATTTWRNLSQVGSVGTDVSVNARLTDRATGNLAATIFYEHATGSGIDRHGIFFHLRGSMDVRLAPQTSAQLYAYRRSAQNIEQGKMHAVWNSDVAITHRLRSDRRGALTLRLSDPFDSQRTAFHIGDRTFLQHSERKTTSRMLSLSFSWSLRNELPEAHRPDESAPRIF